VHRSLFISVFNQLDAQNLFHNKFYFMPLHVSSTCAHHQEVKIALHRLWYHHTYRCDDKWTEIDIHWYTFYVCRLDGQPLGNGELNKIYTSFSFSWNGNYAQVKGFVVGTPLRSTSEGSPFANFKTRFWYPSLKTKWYVTSTDSHFEMPVHNKPKAKFMQISDQSDHNGKWQC